MEIAGTKYVIPAAFLSYKEDSEGGPHEIVTLDFDEPSMQLIPRKSSHDSFRKERGLGVLLGNRGKDAVYAMCSGADTEISPGIFVSYIFSSIH